MSIRSWFWLIGLLLLAFFLRIYQLDGQSIWWDEGISLHLATSKIGEIARDRLNNIHPPLYFYLLKFWLAFTGVSAFSGRYLSVLAGWFQVGFLFAIGCRWYSSRTAFVAAILGALSAVSIIYSQEIRVYSVLPLIYLALLILVREATGQGPDFGKGKLWVWLLFGSIIWIGMHLHYITVFVVLYINLWAIFVYVKSGRWSELKRWIVFQLVVVLTVLPWYISMILNWAAVSGEANAGTYTSAAVPLQHLANQVWTFLVSGLPGLIVRPGALISVASLAGLLIILFILRLVKKNTRREASILFANWMIPLTSALVVWAARSFSHPRYIAMFVPGLLLLVAYLVMPPVNSWTKRWAWSINLLAGALLAGVLLASIWGLVLYFYDANVAKDDMRSVARYLEKNADGPDLILVPDTDWSLRFEYKGETPIEMPHLDDADGGWSHLAQVTEEKKRVFLVDYLNGTRDWQEKVRFSLVKSGSIVNREVFDNLSINEYELDEKVTPPQMSPTTINYDPMVLSGVWIDQNSETSESVAIALNWQLSRPVDQSAQASLRLLDEHGALIAASDDLLRDRNGRPTDQWQVGDQVTTYHVIPLPAAVPPVEYTVGLQVYFATDLGIQPLEIRDRSGAPRGQDASLGSVKLNYEPSQDTNLGNNLPLALWPNSSEIAPGLSLLAADIENAAFVPGSVVTVRLLWQATSTALYDLRPEVALVQGSEDLDLADEAPVYGQYPTTLWNLDETVLERRHLRIPPATSGVLHVVIRFKGMEWLLGEVEVVDEAHVFEQIPSAYEIDATFGNLARLTGFDIEKAEYRSGESIPLSLVWQSRVNGSDREYVVFTHLLDESGRLIGQHDAVPVNGLRSMTGWVEHEYIVDRHDLAMREPYQGKAFIEVGLYDPVSGDRVLLPDGSDHYILPFSLDILP